MIVSLVKKHIKRRNWNPVACLILVLWFTLNCGRAVAPKYGLPITLGSTSDEVRKIIGGPTERYKVPNNGETEVVTNPDKKDNLLEWYYSSGIIAAFDRDRLTTITLPTYTDYRGFLAYAGTVVKGVRLTDSRQDILSKLGNPTKIESDELESGTDPNVPVVWPKKSRYYWHLDDFLVQADFLNQAQQASEKAKLIFPKDSLLLISITK